MGWMHVEGDKIYAADLRESFHIFKYRRSDNQLFVLSDDSAPRWMTCASVLDNVTMAGADKFDNFFICRIPEECRDDEGGDLSGLRLKADTAYLTGATPKLDHVVQFHVGDSITALEKTTLSQGGRDHIMYRSYHFPVQNCVDGDLCEQFVLLPHDKQRLIASELDRTPAEIIKKLEDMRNRLL